MRERPTGSQSECSKHVNKVKRDYLVQRSNSPTPKQNHFRFSANPLQITRTNYPSSPETPSGFSIRRKARILPEFSFVGRNPNMLKTKISVEVVTLCGLLVLALVMPGCHCAKKPNSAARKEDVPYIKCRVCEKIASELFHQVKKKQAQISPKKISEYQIIEIAENVCNLKKEEADWILKIDLVENGDKLELVEQDAEGICNVECKTIERACQEVVGYSDTDVAEYLYKLKPQLDSLVEFLCKDLTSACNTPPPPLPKDRTPGEAFMPKPTKDAEMEKIMRSMEGIPGAPGMKMYSRDELMNMKNFGEAGDEEDEDEDNDDGFPSKLGNVFRNKQEPKHDWKKKVTEGIKTTAQVLKRHATKASYRLNRWWNGVRKPATANNKGKKSEL